ncbi:unnamed protein product [Didymodactylos carnosus]|uniref:FAD-binding PCMH-type domain-containing protein n=1 Tax=Didymodactylos carnosus TaxID=1234261 RepID=A0A814MYI5_9BILA|nr:unnamed protein product [Didymodactylos carnosus]CAF1085039.1 unnamed protein product [Didymodactylos carnosus]CAF3687561.1 unnamed protein product [Didymodactylos carnosus]CAF3850613.1 unnamed protein product [Didymodactylos carnosus]
MGMTWVKWDHLSTFGIDLVGCQNWKIQNGFPCNAYTGDTDCNTKLPVLCAKFDQSPRPAYGIYGQGAAMSPEFYAGWNMGHISTTVPVKGSSYKTLSAVDMFCATSFGKGWRTATFHDGQFIYGMNNTVYAGAQWSLNVKKAQSGEILIINETHEPDLYWALRGGGGGFFVIVTELKIRLVKTPSLVTVVSSTWHPNATKLVIQRYQWLLFKDKTLSLNNNIFLGMGVSKGGAQISITYFGIVLRYASFLPPQRMAPVRRRRVIQSILLHVLRKKKTFEKLVDAFKPSQSVRIEQLVSDYVLGHFFDRADEQMSRVALLMPGRESIFSEYIPQSRLSHTRRSNGEGLTLTQMCDVAANVGGQVGLEAIRGFRLPSARLTYGPYEHHPMVGPSVLGQQTPNESIRLKDLLTDENYSAEQMIEMIDDEETEEKVPRAHRHPAKGSTPSPTKTNNKLKDWRGKISQPNLP